MNVNMRATSLLLGLVAILGLAAIPWPVESDSLQSALARDQLAPGYVWRVATRASLTLLPRPTLRLTLPELRDGAGHTALRARKAVISLAPGPLLFGHFVASSTQLIDADVNFDTDALAARLSDAAGLRALARGRLELVRARIAWSDASGARSGRLLNVDGWIDWPGADRPATYRLSGLWRDQVLHAEGAIDAPGQLLAGQPSQASIAFASPPLDFAFSGQSQAGAEPRLSGDLQLALRDPDLAWALLGDAATPPPTKPFDLRGQIEANLTDVQLSQASLHIGTQPIDGSLHLRRREGRWKASGTLAADRLDMASLVGPPPALLDAYGLWRAELTLPRPYEPLDLDLRVSAADIIWGDAEASDVAATLTQERGALQVNLVEAKAYEGIATGALSLSGCDTTCRAHVALSLTGARLDPLQAALGLKLGLSGHGSLDFDLGAAGATLGEAMQSVAGTLDFDMQDGSIAGLNLEEALRRSQRRPVDPARDMAAGESHFTEARLALVFRDGLGEIAQGRIDSPAAVAEAEGVIDLLHREIRAKLSARQVGPEGAPSPDAARLGISISGPWALPNLTTLPGVN